MAPQAQSTTASFPAPYVPQSAEGPDAKPGEARSSPALKGGGSAGSVAALLRRKGTDTVGETPLDPHYAPKDLSDRVAFAFTKVLRYFADAFFARRYGHRAVVLETIAAVPGMVGGALQHLRSLRRLKDDRGWIRTLLEEAENERLHLMVFMHIARPSNFERLLILLAQGLFCNFFFLLYLVSPRTAHRVTGYFEEEAVHSYTEYLAAVDAGTQTNVSAPRIAIDYWKLSTDARLHDVIVAVRADEARHRDVNHRFANELAR